MALARWGPGSDVYVYQTAEGRFCCQHMPFDETPGRPDELIDADRSDMVEHLRQHQAAGDAVPDDLIPTIIQGALDEARPNGWRETHHLKSQTRREIDHIVTGLEDAGIQKRRPWWKRVLRRV